MGPVTKEKKDPENGQESHKVPLGHEGRPESRVGVVRDVFPLGGDMCKAAARKPGKNDQGQPAETQEGKEHIPSNGRRPAGPQEDEKHPTQAQREKGRPVNAVESTECGKKSLARIHDLGTKKGTPRAQKDDRGKKGQKMQANEGCNEHGQGTPGCRTGTPWGEGLAIGTTIW